MSLDQQQAVEDDHGLVDQEPSLPTFDTGQGYYSPAQGVIAESGTNVSEAVYIPGEGAHRSYVFPPSIDELIDPDSPWSTDYERPTLEYAQAAAGGELEINNYSDIRYYMDDNKEFRDTIEANWDGFQDKARVYDYSYQDDPFSYLHQEFAKRDAAINTKLDPTYENPYLTQEVGYHISKGMEKHPQEVLPALFGQEKPMDLSDAIAANDAANASDTSKDPGIGW